MQKMRIELPLNVKMILDIIEIEFKKKAYAVGGCVRDSLLNRKPNDWDITTEATPDEIKSIFNHTIDTGIKHGTVTVIIGQEAYEVTTFRVDGNYSDGRRPDSVTFTTDIKEDLARRDFTINSMAYNHEEGLIDPFNGQQDLKEKVIRCVGNPHERFEEDALRMMRAVRFAAQLEFKLDGNTLLAIEKNAEKIQNVSTERIKEEINKILLSDKPYYIELLYFISIIKYIMPEFEACFGVTQNNPYHIYDVGRHTLKVLENIGNNLDIRLAALFHDIGKPDCKTVDSNGVDHFYKHAIISADKAQEIMKRLKYDNETIEKVVTLVKYHDVELKPEYPFVKRWLNKIGIENFQNLIELRKADIAGQNLAYIHERTEKIKEVEKIMCDVMYQQQCFTLKDLAVNGLDLISIGYKAGIQLGEMLKELLNIVIDNPEKNNKEYLVSYAKERLQENER